MIHSSAESSCRPAADTMEWIALPFKPSRQCLGGRRGFHFVGFPDALTVPPSGVFVALVLVVCVATLTVALIVRRDRRGTRRSLLEHVRIWCRRGRRAFGPVSAVGTTWPISSPATKPLLVPSWGPGVLVVRRLALSVTRRLALSVVSLLLLLRWRSSWLLHNCLRIRCTQNGAPQ